MITKFANDFSVLCFSDFDEKTSDDWDVDMSVYYEPGIVHNNY